MSIKAFSDYLLIEKNYSELTLKAYLNDIQGCSEFIVSEYDTGLLDVSYFQIRSWIINLVEAGLSNRSINRKVSSLTTYFKFLLSIGDIDSNPLSKHKVLKSSKKLQIPFSEAEMKEVFKLLEIDTDFEGLRNRLIVELFYATGIRRIELVNLKLKDIDSGNGNLKVLGKRNKERIIPLIPTLQEIIQRYISARSQLNVIKDSEHLFLTKKGIKIYENLVYRIINGYFSTVSSKVKTSPHILRHSFATHMLNQGANLNAVKELLGHSSLAATQVYTHNNIADLKKVYAKSHPRSED